MYVWWMILGINCSRSLPEFELGAGSSPRRMASSRPVATSRPSNVQTLCTAKPSTTTVTRINMVTPRLMVAAAARLRPPFPWCLACSGVSKSRAHKGCVGVGALGCKHSWSEGDVSGSRVSWTWQVEAEKKRPERKVRETRPVLVAMLAAAPIISLASPRTLAA